MHISLEKFYLFLWFVLYDMIVAQVQQENI